MERDRRAFLGRLTAGAALAAGWSVIDPTLDAAEATPRPSRTAETWDVAWPDRITGKSRAVFDCVELADGGGFLRAIMWKRQYAEVLGISAADTSAVVVLRHAAIPLAMSQEYWDRYKVGDKQKVKNPFTDHSTTKNPILLPAAELGGPFAGANLDGFLKDGGIALACNLALFRCIHTIAKAEKVDDAEARKRAIALLAPGVILQPSGVFAAIRAQEAGCHYLKAS